MPRGIGRSYIDSFVVGCSCIQNVSLCHAFIKLVGSISVTDILYEGHGIRGSHGTIGIYSPYRVHDVFSDLYYVFSVVSLAYSVLFSTWRTRKPRCLVT